MTRTNEAETGLRGIGLSSLRWKLVALIAVLLAAVVLFLFAYFPRRMETFSQQWSERRAIGMASLLSATAAPGVEFDDSVSVTELLNGLSATPEVLYASVRRSNGSLLAVYHAERLPEDVPIARNAPVVTYANGAVRVDAPIHAKGGSAGTLSIGFLCAKSKTRRARIAKPSAECQRSCFSSGSRSRSSSARCSSGRFAA